jgi:large repetitive protein
MRPTSNHRVRRQVLVAFMAIAMLTLLATATGGPQAAQAQATASISGFVWVDLNADGNRDSGEGLSGVQITRSGTGSTVTTTSVTGAYSFTGLAAGTYAVSEPTQPAGWADGPESVGTAGGSAGADTITGINLGAGVAATGYNFGERGGSLSGFVYNDIDNDGVKEAGESGISGVTINLGGSSGAVTTTNSAGAYSFVGLIAGTYSIAESQPAGWIDGFDTVGSAGGLVTNDLFTNIVLTAGATGTNYNFGERVGAAASLSGFVYHDIDNDGLKDAAEPGIAGVVITLNGSTVSGPVNLNTVTVAGGGYLFPNLPAGTYSISETQPLGWTDGKDTIGTPGGLVGNDVFSNIVLNPGVNGANNNFGELQPFGTSLSGSVYLDANDDGIFGIGELGITNVLITLTGTNDLGQPVNMTRTTDSFGDYVFENLRPGTYRITETQPVGFTDGRDTIGTAGGVVSNDSFSSIFLDAGEVGTDYNFGELRSTALMGSVYIDSNDNGVRDTGELGIAGVTITLTGTDDVGASVGRTATTASDGSYAFVNLRSGVYRITETQPAGYADGKDAVGTAGGVLGNDSFSSIVLGQGVAGTGYTFGERPLATPTATRVPPTVTPVPPTPRPANTATPTPIRVAPLPPNTGTGGSGAGSAPWLLLVAVALAGSAGVLTVRRFGGRKA